MIKAIYKEHTANIKLNDERPKAFLLRSGAKQGYPLLFNIVLGVLDSMIKHQKEIKDTQIGKEGAKLSLFTDDDFICRKS